MSDSSSVNEMKLSLTLEDPRAIDIVENLPAEKRDEIIIKPIIT